MHTSQARDMSLRIAGEGGEGVISAGEMLTQVVGRQGVNIQTYKTFPSEIRGGMAVYQIRVGKEQVHSQGDILNALVAFNREGYERNIEDLDHAGVLVHQFDPGGDLPRPRREGIDYYVPMEALAKTAGSARSKNMVAVGAICQLFGIPLEGIRDAIRLKFGSKSQKLVEMNIKAVELGAAYVGDNLEIKHDAEFPIGDKQARVVMTGNQAIGYGALVGGCRFFAGYPITPATDVMEWLAHYLPRVGGCMIQAEDEIASMCMCLGASFAGKLAMTATSGPGLSLMTEALGLASMAEIPLVVVDVQRAGPSTGMPTKAEQGDLDLAISGAHSTAKRVVLAPIDVEDTFYQTVNAFNIAAKYQTPVLILTETALAFAKASMPRPDLGKLDIFREEFPSRLSDQEAWPKVDQVTIGEGYPMTPIFPRYLRTLSGVSPRSLPGMRGMEYRATGLEHDEYARPRYDAANRKQMVSKRLRKIEMIRREYNDHVEVLGHPDAEVAVTGWGSTAAVLREAVHRKLAAGARIKAIFPKMLCPMPDAAMRRHFQGVRRVVVCEMNATGQFASIIRHRYQMSVHAVLKDHGTPFAPADIVPHIEMVLEGEVRI